MNLITKRLRAGPKFLAGHGHVVADYGISDMNGPGRRHFSITGTAYRSERCLGGQELEAGCIHETIAAAFPELAALIPWHLVNEEAPMHYIANGVHWYEYLLGLNTYPLTPGHDAAENFRSTIVFGALPTDEADLAQVEADITALDLSGILTTLENREHDHKEAQGRIAAAEAALKRLKEEEYQCKLAVAVVRKELAAAKTAPVKAWLERRKAALQARFLEVMAQFGLAE